MMSLPCDAGTDAFSENNKKSTEAIIKIPFESARRADIVYRVLSVDKEPSRNFVQKELRLVGDEIEVHFKTAQVKTYEQQSPPFLDPSYSVRTQSKNLPQVLKLLTPMPEHTPAPTPHRAVYGFSFYLLFFTLFILYLMWALLPTESWGLNYLPDKYFAAYLPILVLMGMFVFEFFIYPGIGLAMTPNVDELESVMDTALLLRHAESDKSAHFNSSSVWARVRYVKQATPRKERKVLSDCDFCHGTHRLPAAHEQISTLRFLDLQDVNNVYD